MPTEIPHTIEGTLMEQDVINAANFLIIQGRPTPMCCAGAVCLLRELAPVFGDVNTDLHYTKSHVSIKSERTRTKYWKKDTSADEIDAAYDAAFDAALKKFGHTQKWFPLRKRIEKFFLKRMQPFINQTFRASLQPTRSKPRPSGATGAGGSGGHVRNIQCHQTRTEKINKMLSNFSSSTQTEV